ncbi:molybdenum cofactor guanylyltransferase [Natroniella sp. ANB-PHB2]|uniref:molybdenum cofactor guanylyltransferase n=1 Tax=Natroniella sp. ANB-PHB2 TaxID=3384444 RepID=UPI0038D46AB4
MNAILLAGGESSRFGTNKALAKLGGQRLIERISRILKKNFDKVYVVVNNKKDYSFLEGVELVKDIIPYQGPLGGLYTGLNYSSAQYNFLLACDMPCINGAYLKFLQEQKRDYDLLISQLGDCLEPLAAVYSKNCLPAIKKRLEMKDLKLTNFFSEVKVKTINEEELKKIVNPEYLFYNVNYQADLEQLVAEFKS